MKPFTVFAKKKPRTCLARAYRCKVLSYCALFLFFLVSPLFPYLTSLCVMGVYSHMNEKESLLATEEIRLHIPGGLKTVKSDWYPFVMTYCADWDFKRYTGNPELSLTILYNFPAFSAFRGCSHLYDTNSPYYNSFYGAYLIKNTSGRPFGFTETDSGQFLPNPNEAVQIPEYDFFRLVLSEFGVNRENAVFSWQVTNLSGPQNYAGLDGFTRIDAHVTVNGSSHVQNGFTPSYLQYGYPLFPCEDPLAPVSMYGRLYGTYLKEKQVSLYFYIIAADPDVLEECDRRILSKSILKP